MKRLIIATLTLAVSSVFAEDIDVAMYERAFYTIAMTDVDVAMYDEAFQTYKIYVCK